MRLAEIGVALTSPFDVQLEPECISQSDVFVLPRAEARRVAIEMPKYQRHVPEYWIADLDARLFERWRPHEDRPEVLTELLEWHPPAAQQALRMELAKFFDAVFELPNG
jgi:Uma2 family endonuclease